MKSPKAIGEAFAIDTWASHGRSVIPRARTYQRALVDLKKLSGAPAEARQAFDRHLARLAAAAVGHFEAEASPTHHQDQAEEDRFVIIDEIDDLLTALKYFSEGLPSSAQIFAGLEQYGARPALSPRSFERIFEELQEFVDAKIEEDD